MLELKVVLAAKKVIQAAPTAVESAKALLEEVDEHATDCKDLLTTTTVEQIKAETDKYKPLSGGLVGMAHWTSTFDGTELDELIDHYRETLQSADLGKELKKGIGTMGVLVAK